MEKNTRMERRKLLEQREELQKVIFEDKKKPKKNRGTNLILFIVILSSLVFSQYIIYNSFNEVNQIYQIINACFILLIAISFVIAFKKAYKKKKGWTIITSLLLLGFMGFNTLVNTNILVLPTQSNVPNFTSGNLEKAISWAEENNIEYNTTYEYSDNISKNDVIMQSVKEGSLTKNIDKINFSISSGPDYNKEVIITNMEGKNIDYAVKVIKKNFLNNVVINFEENSDVTRDIITKQSKSGNMKRNDEITFTVSLGNKDDLKEITFKDLKNMSLFDATLYLNRNAIDYELKYEFSDTIEKGNVISSSIKKGTKVKPFDKVTLTISKGKKIVVPNLVNKKMSEVTKWITENNLKISYSDKYDNSIKKNRVIEATYKEGDIIEEETTIGIIVSKGKLKMKSFDNVTAFQSWANEYGIKYEIKEEFNESIKKGDIVSFSIKKGDIINPDEGVTVTVSKGKAVDVPNFKNKSKSEVQSSCNSLNIKCTFINEYSSSVKEGYVISQSKSGQIAEGDSIEISIATKNKNNVTKTVSNSSQTSSNNSTKSNTNTSTNKTNQNQCTKDSYSINLNNIFNNYSGYDNVYKALKNLEKEFPGITVNVGNDPSSDMSPGSFVSGFKRGNVKCPGTISIVISK